LVILAETIAVSAALVTKDELIMLNAVERLIYQIPNSSAELPD
jgi:hypothetical protein